MRVALGTIAAATQMAVACKTGTQTLGSVVDVGIHIAQRRM